MPRTHASIWTWAAAACVIVTMVARFGILQQRRWQAVEEASGATAALHPPDPRSPPPAADGEPARTAPAAPRNAGLQVFADTLGRDGSIYQLLKRARISEAQIVELDRVLAEVFDARRDSRPRDRLLLSVDTAGVVQSFRYVPWAEPERPVLVERQPDGLTARRLEQPLESRLQAVEATIEDNLANAISDAGEGDALTDVLADDIFGSVIDFRRDTRRGDRIGLVFEKLYHEGRMVRYGRVLMAVYEGQVTAQTGVYYGPPGERGGYYDAGGKSLQRMFLLYALPSRRITSHFNRQRFHPVLHRTIPHLGTDYGAPVGTPVHATARGRVVHAGWRGALGRAVIVEHPNGYVTRYGHLSEILVRKGQTVAQKELVGRVGATGRVTGPHLHYEVIRNGKHLDPEAINRGARGTPLNHDRLPAFAAYRDSLMAVLAHQSRDGARLAQRGAAPPAVD